MENTTWNITHNSHRKSKQMIPTYTVLIYYLYKIKHTYSLNLFTY